MSVFNFLKKFIKSSSKKDSLTYNQFMTKYNELTNLINNNLKKSIDSEELFKYYNILADNIERFDEESNNILNKAKLSNEIIETIDYSKKSLITLQDNIKIIFFLKIYDYSLIYFKKLFREEDSARKYLKLINEMKHKYSKIISAQCSDFISDLNKCIDLLKYKELSYDSKYFNLMVLFYKEIHSGNFYFINHLDNKYSPKDIILLNKLSLDNLAKEYVLLQKIKEIIRKSLYFKYNILEVDNIKYQMEKMIKLIEDKEKQLVKIIEMKKTLNYQLDYVEDAYNKLLKLMGDGLAAHGTNNINAISSILRQGVMSENGADFMVNDFADGFGKGGYFITKAKYLIYVAFKTNSTIHILKSDGKSYYFSPNGFTLKNDTGQKFDGNFSKIFSKNESFQIGFQNETNSCLDVPWVFVTDKSKKHIEKIAPNLNKAKKVIFSEDNELGKNLTIIEMMQILTKDNKWKNEIKKHI